jgi:LuxR family transcriptional regulator, regulator of acetate metabolism
MSADATALARTLEEELRERVAGVVNDARMLLGLDVDAAGHEAGAREISEFGAALTARLRATGDDVDDAERAHDLALKRLCRRFDERSAALGRIDEAVARLRRVTSPQAMLARAPEELCLSSDLDRVILSRVDAGTMVANAAFFRDDEAGAQAVLEQLRAEPIRLDHSLIETEVLRRRRATVVVDARIHPRVHRPTAELLGWHSYVAAPIVERKRVIAVVHADRRVGEVDVLHRDVLWQFASGVAQALESATLRRTLRNEREQLRQFLNWLDARSGELNDAEIDLGLEERPRLPPPAPLEGGPPRFDDRTVFEGVITRRELDVLRLLAEGSSNRAIAEELVIAQGTVKFHVRGILRKLRAANRAEAVSRYVKLVGSRQIR